MNYNKDNCKDFPLDRGMYLYFFGIVSLVLCESASDIATLGYKGTKNGALFRIKGERAIRYVEISKYRRTIQLMFTSTFFASYRHRNFRIEFIMLHFVWMCYDDFAFFILSYALMLLKSTLFGMSIGRVFLFSERALNTDFTYEIFELFELISSISFWNDSTFYAAIKKLK